MIANHIWFQRRAYSHWRESIWICLLTFLWETTWSHLYQLSLWNDILLLKRVCMKPKPTYVSVISCVLLCVPRARLSIYRGCIWHDGARSPVVSTITLRSGLHSRTTPSASPFWTSYGVSFVSYICKNDHDISRKHDTLFLFPSDNSCLQLMLFVCICNRR